MRKQDAIFAILSHFAAQDGNVLRRRRARVPARRLRLPARADSNYLPGPDDVYVSTSQIRRFNLRTGDHVQGTIRPPKDGERYFALIKVDTINGESPEVARDKILFDNLTPLYPQQKFDLEIRSCERRHQRERCERRESVLAADHRHDRAHRQRAALPHRVAAARRQDGPPAEHRQLDRPEPSGRAPHRAAHRRAPRRGDRHAADSEGGGRFVDVRRAGRPATWRSPRW